MAVKLAFNRVEQFANGSGVPYSGAKLFTYTAGSTTKQTTYTESTGSTPNTNPIVLDSSGQLPQPVWLTAGVNYKLVLAPSTDTDPPASPIWTLDNVSGINDTTSAVNEWIAGPAPTYISATSFSLVGDQTTVFHVGRRLKTTNTAGTVYSTITASVFGALTTVTVVNDSGSLDSGLSAVSYGLLARSNHALPGVRGSVDWAIGDLLVGTATNLSRRKSVGTDGRPLIANASATDGLEYAEGFQRKNTIINGCFRINQRLPATNADDTYAHDRWYALTQTGTIALSTVSDAENTTPYMARLTQSQAAAQRMGYAQIIEGKNCKHLRGKQVTFRFGRVRISNSQAVRYAVLEWTGTEDSVTSDVVNDWTSSDYTDGAAKFFVDANITPSGNTSHTPAAATLTDGPSLTVTLGSTFNNLIVLAWTEGTAAQNVTLDLAKSQIEVGSVATEFERVLYQRELDVCLAYYEKSYDVATAPGTVTSSGAFVASITISANNFTVISAPVWFKATKRTSPTMTGYSTVTGASGKFRDTTAAADINSSFSSTGTQVSTALFNITASSTGSATGHFTADAEL